MYKSGLVLEGGGLRAVYSSGVLDAFIENGIEFPYVIGVSAGTCNGASFLGKNLHRMKDITINYSSDERYMGLKWLVKNGEYLNTEWIYGELTYDICPLDYDTFENSGSVFCCVLTNINTGKAEYFYPKEFRNGCPEIQASCALPLATRPVEIGMGLYYDGGIVDSIPLERAFDDGCEKCVVILTQDRDYVKHPLAHAKAISRLMKKTPAVAERLKDRHNMYNNQRSFVFQQERLGSAFVIAPKEPLNCSTLEADKEKLTKIYNMGYQQGLESLEELRKFLED